MYQPNLPPSSVSTKRRTRTNVVELNHISQSREKVSQLPLNNSAPSWLKSLLTLQKGAAMMFGTVFCLSLGIYGYTVQTQDLWKHQHGQLKHLQIQERQQGIIDENLRHRMAEAAEEKESGLVSPNPKQMVFLPSAQSRPPKSLTSPKQPTPTSQKPPLGY